MNIEILKAPPEHWTFAALLVDDTWIVELTYTIMGSIRVTLRKKESGSLNCNWCCGQEALFIILALNACLGYIETGEVDKMPFASDPKPYWKDQSFIAHLFSREQKHYFTDLKSIQATAETTKSTSDYEQFATDFG